MEKIKKIISLALVLMLVVQMNVIYANASATETELDKEPIEIKAVNLTIEETDDGIWYTADLVKEITEEDNPSRLISWIVVGVISFRLKIYSGNSLAQASWQVQLTNDFVKAVKGTFVLEEDILGPVNPNYGKKNVDYYDSIGAYSRATGSVAFSFYEDDDDQDIILKWRSFTITGVKDYYSVDNGSIQGKVNDFFV